ncbi:MAG: SpoIVB peptidase S55 domain-containing protein [bacterium JZ-2024 1]
MKQNAKGKIWIFAVGILLAGSATPASEIIPVEEIQRGMKGYALTVFAGNEVERFAIEVEGVLKNFYPKRDIILIRFTDEKGKQSGVVSGMSGSPVFIEGRLAGALAYRMGIFQKEPIAGVTPIKEMLEVVEKEKVREKERPPFSFYEKAYKASLGLEMAEYLKDKQERLLAQFGVRQEEGISPIPLTFALSFAGRDKGGYLEKILRRLGWEVVPGMGAGGGGGAPVTSEMTPGSPFSVPLIWGDETIFATGTLTYRKGNQLYAFGHPFFDAGPVQLPLGSASIVTTMASQYASFKIANFGEVLGTLKQDRRPAVFGILGESPPHFPIQVQFRIPWSATQQFQLYSAEDPSIHSLNSWLIPFLLYSLYYSGEDVIPDEMNLQVNGSIKLKGGEEIPFTDFYGGAPAFSSLFFFFSFSIHPFIRMILDLMSVLDSLYYNGFREVELAGIQMQIDIHEGLRYAELQRAWLDKSRYAPGERVHLTVEYKPYKTQKLEKKTVIFDLPSDLPEGSYTLFVGGKDNASWEEFRYKNLKVYSFEQILQDLRERKKGDRLYLFLISRKTGWVQKRDVLPYLPNSVLRTLQRDTRSYQDNRRVYGYIHSSYEFSFPFEISGSQYLSLEVKRK